MIDWTWLVYLLLAVAWTVFFSLFNRPAIRGWRNLGWVGCYVVGFVMVWGIGWWAATTTWCVMGLASGVLYYGYDVWASWGRARHAARAQVATILYGVVLWPIMLPEVIEYTLADAGALKARPSGQRP